MKNKNNSEQHHINRVERLSNLIARSDIVHLPDTNRITLISSHEKDVILVIDGYKSMIYLYLVHDFDENTDVDLRIEGTDFIAVNSANSYRVIDIAARFNAGDSSAFRSVTEEVADVDTTVLVKNEGKNLTYTISDPAYAFQSKSVQSSPSKTWKDLKAKFKSRADDAAEAFNSAVQAATSTMPVTVIHGLTQDISNNILGYHPDILKVGDEVMTPIGKTRFRIKRHIGWNSIRSMNEYELMSLN